MNEFTPLFNFEKQIADFFNAPYAIGVDCCTHGLEMCIQATHEESDSILCPTQTYISVPFMLEKINKKYLFKDVEWDGYYHLTSKVVDAATLWKKDSYIPHTCMCISFHIKKHINIGRGGMILLDDYLLYKKLQKMRYDGRSIYDEILYSDDNITEIGYHYYMTPETAADGIKIFEQKKDLPPKIITYKDYTNITQFSYFKNKYK
jgi:dTDP-4-amino-4,6-dideoxygalactose transaminase